MRRAITSPVNMSPLDEEGPESNQTKALPLPQGSDIQSIQCQSKFNIVLFGEMGAGKSSLVNLILDSDHDVARISSGASSCTFDARPYDVTIRGQDFRIFDTVGLSEPQSLRDPGCLIGAINKMYSLVRYLSDTGGINLLVFCVRKGRINVNMQQNYMLFHDFLCHKKVPVALVITHLEHEENMEDWWLENQSHFTERGIHVIGHACTTAKRAFGDRYHMSRQAVHNLLIAHGCGGGFAQEGVSWVTDLFQKLLDFVGSRPCFDSIKGRARKLHEYGLEEEEISTILMKISAGDEDRGLVRSSRPRTFMRTLLHGSNASFMADPAMTSFNIILFGEAGVGKSSVINLIAGREVAAISPYASGRTLSSQRYTFPVDGRTFHIWDTAGLDQPRIGTVGCMEAIEGAFALIQQLAQDGGIDLLLFCMRRGRVTTGMLSNYRLFFEILCRSQVPIALVITHLENEPDMEAWWTRNSADLEKCGIKSAGHACVTGLPTHSKYPESRANIERMLRQLNGQGKYVMPADSWFVEFVGFLGSFSPGKQLRRKDLLKLLINRCGLSSNAAHELAERLLCV